MLRNALTTLLLLLTTFAGSAAAQQSAPVPSPQQFLGYEIGSRFTPHHAIVSYFDELARRSPKVHVVRYGETYEGRPLIYAVITSEQNGANIESIRQNLSALSSPSATSPERARQLAEATPAVVWLAYGVHGNESSSSEAAMLVAHELVAGAESDALLQNTVVIIDPLQNPDGRERYIHNFQQRRGQLPDPSPLALEHSEPWAQGRYNHYFIDMNRDWAWGSQQETRARIAAFRQWMPQVFVDLHEMSPEESYFFPPDARPINANLPSDTEKWLEVFGRANANAFSSRGWPFFVGETFDLFYPAYGDSWPTFQGAIGMTYEMAGGGRAGTVYRRVDGDLLTLAERAEHHFVSSMTTVRTAAAARRDLLLRTYNARAAQTARGRTTYVIPTEEVNSSKIAELLQMHGVALARLRTSAKLRATSTTTNRAETRDFAAGSLVISTAQPLGGFVQSLFEKSAKFDETFITEQREKTSNDEPTEFYDITAWALPLAMNVRAFAVDGRVDAAPYIYDQSAGGGIAPAGFAWLVDSQQSDFYTFVGRLLRAGVRFSVSETELSAGGRRLPRGSLVIEKAKNPADIAAILGRAAAGNSVRVTPVDSVWSEGPALGSTRIAFVRDPQIGLVGGEGVDANSFGQLWHTLDVETEVPHTVIPMKRLGTNDLNQFRVIVLPDTDESLVSSLGKGGVDALQNWVKSGGTLVAIKGAGAALRAKEVGISSVKEWEEPKKKDEKDDTTAPPTRRNDSGVPGAAFATTMNERSYLTFGVPGAPAVLIEGPTALTALPRKGDNVVTIAETEPLVSGFAFAASIDRLKGAPYLTRERLGKGSVITFADQPNYRLFWRATLPLFMNAVLYSPSFGEKE